MTIDIADPHRKDALHSLQRYFRENMDEEIGTLRAESLLLYFLEELGPVIYNQAVADVQERLQARVMEIDMEIHEEPFQYWPKIDRTRRKK
ncbi:MAG: DUF2164 domain-containing protein [Betaproteobacteria bacterium]